eukprot:TRINITY_DN13836_c0_g1_i2.p2 TRINITY_DN13836_c0_g1~~TRINITY_DN13836_c0_g1_i2.p2  ORF type:complete len:175 (-),score=35.54 TRINITY_DN13836_c0_g1_i2:74-598(-)
MSNGLALRVSVKRASGLALPEYRPGDIAVNTLSKVVPESWARADLSRVYVELSFQGSKARTKEVKSEGKERTVVWDAEEHLLPVTSGLAGSKESLELNVTVKDAKKMRAFIFGDPVIGEGVLMGFGTLFKAPGQTIPIDMEIMTRNSVPRSAGKLRLELAVVAAPLAEVEGASQ